MVDKQAETPQETFKNLLIQETKRFKIEICEEDLKSLEFRIFELGKDPIETVEMLFEVILSPEEKASLKRIVQAILSKINGQENESASSKTVEYRRSEEKNRDNDTRYPQNKPSDYGRNDQKFPECETQPSYKKSPKHEMMEIEKPTDQATQFSNKTSWFEKKFPEYETQRTYKKNPKHETMEIEKSTEQGIRFSHKTSVFEEKISRFESPLSINQGLAYGSAEEEAFGFQRKPSDDEFERKKVSSDSPRSPLNGNEEEGKKNDLQPSSDVMPSGRRELSNLRPRKEFESMLEDINKMPPCAERSLNEIICIVSSESPSLDEVEKELKILEAHLIKEELNTASIIKSINEVKVCVRNQGWKQSEYFLFSILKEIRPLNIQEIIRLTEKVADAQKILEGKKAILLMGATGSGISTAVHFLCGSRLVKGSDESGLPHIYPVDVRNEAMRMIKTSAGVRSETKYITAIPLEDPSYVVCDIPGFQDTSGAEIDIANGIGVIKAVMKCKAVKPVLLISEKGIGGRYQGLKNSARTMIRIMPDFKDNIDEITYFFTKFSKTEAAALESKFKYVYQMMNSQEKADLAFISLFEDILIKLQDPKKLSAEFINPVNDNPETVLKHLKDTRFIKNPEEVFKPFVTPHSLEVLKQQLNKHKISIIRAAETRDFELMEYKLDQLKILGHFIGEKEIKEVYEFCVNRIGIRIN